MEQTETELVYTFYLAHPFDSRFDVRKWELEIEQRYGLNICNPFYDITRDDIGSIDAGVSGRYEIDPREIVERDLLAIAKMPALVAIVDGSTSYGTIMEIVYARGLEKKIYIVCTNDHHRHPWLRYHADRIFTSRLEFEAKIGELFDA